MYRAAHRVAVVGAGPSGFYTASYLLKKSPQLQVDMFEKFPFPYGLARYGVAPDHQEVKNCTEQFDATASSDRFRFFGNVQIGQTLKLQELQAGYDAVLLSFGAQFDRSLGIPGEHLQGVLSAREFVGWYNGDPSLQHLQPDLSGQRAAIIGVGNVAIDVARMLLCGRDKLAPTDMASHALDVLTKESNIRDVSIIGRRGPIEASFTIKELRELTRLPGVTTTADQDDVTLTEEEEAWVRATRPKRRLVQLIKDVGTAKASEGSRECHLMFKWIPKEIKEHHSKPGYVGSLVLEKTALQGEIGRRAAVPTGEIKLELETDVVVRSVGFRGANIDSAIPFDEGRGAILHSQGRVEGLPGVYCSGWIKNGPVGTIATTMADAQAVADTILVDLDTCSPKEHFDLGPQLKEATSYDDWLFLKEFEQQQGAERSKLAEKLTDLELVKSLLASRG